MGIFYDELQFDDRVKEDLFTGTNSREPGYADILKRWASGNRLTDYEQEIATSILIFYPEYILDYGKAKEFIELARKFLQQPDLQNSLNPEKGLFLYTLLKQGRKEESIEVLEILEIFFFSYDQANGTIGNHDKKISETDYINKSNISAFSKFPLNLENAYTRILTLIMDCSEILSLKPGFNISQLPGLPFKKLSVFEGTGFRSQALELYHKKEYGKASAIYRRMLINKFESPGTLTHMARLEIICGNMGQAGIFIVNAWRIRQEAPAYVLARILYFIILINMARTVPFDKWIGCLKKVCNQPESKMQWDMERLLSQYEKDFPLQHISLVQTLLEVLSGSDDEEQLNKFEVWQKTAPIPFEEWPDFDTVFN
jgi:hypothetical protein